MKLIVRTPDTELREVFKKLLSFSQIGVVIFCLAELRKEIGSLNHDGKRYYPLPTEGF
jgi:hypothetical protein